MRARVFSAESSLRDLHRTPLESGNFDRSKKQERDYLFAGRPMWIHMKYIYI